MNITLSINDQTIERAQIVAQKMGKNLNQIISDYLEELATNTNKNEQWAQFETACKKTQTAPLDHHWRFNRDEANSGKRWFILNAN